MSRTIYGAPEEKQEQPRFNKPANYVEIFREFFHPQSFPKKDSALTDTPPKPKLFRKRLFIRYK
jgi:hypothetical protein